ncbi:MAG: hypothetical protein ACK5U4_25415 [Rhodospirillales bacterium]|jgi:hypothetical protein
MSEVELKNHLARLGQLRAAARPAKAEALASRIGRALRPVYSSLNLPSEAYSDLVDGAAVALGFIRQSVPGHYRPRSHAITLADEGRIRIAPDKKARSGRRGKVGRYPLQEIAVVNHLAFVWFAVTGHTPPKTFGIDPISTFESYVSAVWGCAVWMRINGQERPKRKSYLPITALEALRAWARFSAEIYSPDRAARTADFVVYVQSLKKTN